METRIALQPAYVLHRIPFQNSSLIVDFFTRDYGRVRAVAKGARAAKSRNRSLLQPFQPLLISYSGRTDLKNLGACEAMHESLRLGAQRLYSGLYVNELLVRLIQAGDEHAALYGFYQDTLIALQGSADLASTLRHFEFSLLAELGYGINFETEANSEDSIEAQRHYNFNPEQGFIRCETPSSQSFTGAEILAIRDEFFAETGFAVAAKRLSRLALEKQLGPRPLMSRSLFMARREPAANGHS